MVPEPDISARILIADVTKIGYRMSDFDRHQELLLTEAQIRQLEKFCKMRVNRMPLQYIIGNWDFYGLTIKCKSPGMLPLSHLSFWLANIHLSLGL
jgi:release factor glutamine methyltransferase